MQETLSESAFKFGRSLANGAIGYEDKYGVIHLDCSTDDENDDEVEVAGSAVNDDKQNWMRGYDHPRQRDAPLEHVKIPGTTSRSRLDSKTALNFTEKRADNNHPPSDRDSPEKYSPLLNRTSRTAHGEPHQRLHLDHRGRHAKGLKIHGFEKLRAADHGKIISTGTRKGESFKRSARLLKTNQESHRRNTLPTYNYTSKRIIDVTPPPTPRIPKRNSIIHVTASEEDEPYTAPEKTVQPRSIQVKKNNSGVAKLCTPRANVSSDPFGSNPHPTPPHTPSNLKMNRMRSNKKNSQNPPREILASEFHRSSFESMSPLAMKYDHCNNHSTHRRRRHESEIPLQDLYYSKKRKERRQKKRDNSEIPLQDLYLAPHSPISKFSFHSALSLAREKKKWLLINIQVVTLPACRILNRELWCHPDIADIVSRSFLFLQLNHNDERAKAYIGEHYGGLALDEGREGRIYAGNNRKKIELPHIALFGSFFGA